MMDSERQLHREHSKQDVLAFSGSIQVVAGDKPFEFTTDRNEAAGRIAYIGRKLMTNKPVWIVATGVDHAHVVGVNAVIQAVSPEDVIVKTPFNFF